MSILTTLQAVVDELGLPSLSTVVTSTDQTTRQLLAIANRVGKELKLRFPWPELTREHIITLVTDQESYDLPEDMDRFQFRTHWDRTNHWELDGPLTPQEWQFRKSGITQVVPRRQFRIKGAADAEFALFPTPDAGSNGNICSFEYQSETWIKPKQWVTATTFLAGTYCWNNGNIYQTTLGGVTGATAPTHTSGSVSDGGVTWTYVSAPYVEFLADTDTSLIDETLLGLGIQWRFMRQKGLDYEGIREDYETHLSRQSTAKLSAPVLYLGMTRKPFLLSAASIPDTGFGGV